MMSSSFRTTKCSAIAKTKNRIFNTSNENAKKEKINAQIILDYASETH